MIERIKNTLNNTYKFLEEHYSSPYDNTPINKIIDDLKSLYETIKENEIIEAFKEDYRYNSSFDLVEALKDNSRFGFICEIQHTTDLRKILDNNWDVDYMMRVLHNYLLD